MSIMKYVCLVNLLVVVVVVVVVAGVCRQTIMSISSKTQAYDCLCTLALIVHDIEDCYHPVKIHRRGIGV